MSNGIFILYRILLIVPIVGFLAVIDKASWPFIAAISLPLIAARYLPGGLVVRKGLKEVLAATTLETNKFVPLLLVGSIIFVLNTFPKKLVVPKCEYELAGQIHADVPAKQAVCKSVVFIVRPRIDM